jgi:hypothetical protein
VSKRTRGHIRRRGVAAAGIAAFAGLFVVATALPAAAHDQVLSGQVACSNGNHVITWSIGNRNTPLPSTIVTATATLNGGQVFDVVGAVGSSVPAGGNISATTTVPGGLTGDVVLDVLSRWSDGHQVEQPTFSISLGGVCSEGGTTTTSTTEAPTTTTVEATTSTTVESTTTTEATTSTTVETATTVPSSTTTPSTPITGEGSTATTTTVVTGSLGSTTSAPASGVTAAGNPTGSGNLPFTGSSESGPILGLTSLVGGAFALVLARRRHSKP